MYEIVGKNLTPSEIMSMYPLGDVLRCRVLVNCQEAEHLVLSPKVSCKLEYYYCVMDIVCLSLHI